MENFKKGQKVYWCDPADETSGVYEVYRKINEYIYLVGNAVSEVEANIGELYPLSQKVIFRKWIIDGGIIALFPEQELDDRPRIVASYQNETTEREAEYDFVMEATVPANKNEYGCLPEELKEAGYDDLKIIFEKINVYELLRQMDVIARSLISSQFITDFTEYDAKSIFDGNAKVPFIWQVRDTGTWLYFLNNPDWKKQLPARIEFYEKNRIGNLYYMFDGEKFYPAFLQTIMKLINE
jgi:hypothetical protein